MAAPNQPTGPIQQRLYLKEGSADSDPADYADVVGNNKIVPAAGGGASQVLRATAFGPIDLRGNQASWSPYGSGSERSIAAQATPQEIPFTFVIQEGYALHAAILGYGVGTVVQVVVDVRVDAAAVAYWVEGSIATRTIGFGNPRECTIGMTILKGPSRFQK